LQDVLDKGGDAFYVKDKSEVLLVKNNHSKLKISTKGFGHFMLWTEVNNMVCIEPITHYPLLNTQKYSVKNMKIANGIDDFSVIFKVEKSDCF
jgi:galactose mutarotase-like enzyme